MYMTRDRDSDIVEFWMNREDFVYYSDMGVSDCDSNSNCPVLKLNKKEFKRCFSGQKLPRKGTCKYIELRLYIPGEG